MDWRTKQNLNPPPAPQKALLFFAGTHPRKQSSGPLEAGHASIAQRWVGHPCMPALQVGAPGLEPGVGRRWAAGEPAK